MTSLVEPDHDGRPEPLYKSSLTNFNSWAHYFIDIQFYPKAMWEHKVNFKLELKDKKVLRSIYIFIVLGFGYNFWQMYVVDLTSTNI